jgi:hypothetical protein
MRYKINVLTLKGDYLTYHVSHYDIKDGFVKFTDEKTNKQKQFSCSRCEIEVEEEK